MKLLLVDCDGTLHDNNLRLIQQSRAAAAVLNVSPDDVLKGYYQIHQRIHQEFPDRHNDIAFHFQLLGESFNKNLPLSTYQLAAQQWEAAYDEYQNHPIVFSDAQPFLEAMHQAGVRLALVSGSTKEERQAFLKVMGFDHFFEAVFAANTVGFQKQQPGFYEYVIKQLGIPALDMAIVGDSYNDDMTAKRFGITTILLARPDAPAKKPNEWIPDYTVSSLTDTADLITKKLVS